MSEIDFNVNHYVKVKLTDFGISILQKHYANMSTIYYPDTDEEGYTTFQLWDLMNKFGKHIFIGKEIPFETNIKILKEETK